MTKLLCFGDLHLGQGGQYPGRLDDQRDVLGRIAGIAVEHQVDGILFAGDAFEGPGVLPEQLEVFAQFVDACRTVDIPILAITGNGKHDAAVRDTNGMAIFAHVPGIKVCSTPGVHLFAGCSVAVLPWVHPGRLIARAGRDVPRDEVNTIAADLLVDVARDLLDTNRSSSTPAVLLGHWSVSGTALPTGLPVDDLREPVLPVETLEQLDYDAIVMGHIHRPQGLGSSHDRHILMDDDAIATYGGASAFYTGSPMPLNFGEAHVSHGVWILDLGDVNPKSTFVPVDSPPFVTLDLGVDADVEWSLGDALNAAVGCAGVDGIENGFVRVRFTASAEQMRRVDVAQIRSDLLNAGARHVKVEPSIVREQRARVAGVSAEVGVLDALEQWLDSSSFQGDRELLRSRAAMYLETVA